MTIQTLSCSHCDRSWGIDDERMADIYCDNCEGYNPHMTAHHIQKCKQTQVKYEDNAELEEFPLYEFGNVVQLRHWYQTALRNTPTVGEDPGDTLDLRQCECDYDHFIKIIARLMRVWEYPQRIHENNRPFYAHTIHMAEELIKHTARLAETVKDQGLYEQTQILERQIVEETLRTHNMLC